MENRLSRRKSRRALYVNGTRKNSIGITDILMGDMWVCSGQLNMEMPIGDWGYINNFEAEIGSADYPATRQFVVPKNTSLTLQTTLLGGSWKVCTPKDAAAFSATAYFFAEWAELREAQAIALSLPNTGIAVTTDIGDAKDIHPKNKQDVGKRLAAIALHNTYGINAIGSGPAYQSFKTEGDKLTVTFSGIGSGLLVKDKYGYLKGFEIAGTDKKFYYAQAYLMGDQVIVKSDLVANPVAVRFGWTDDAGDSNLYNKEGFPAAPFRTDNWKGLTEEMKYKVE